MVSKHLELCEDTGCDRMRRNPHEWQCPRPIHLRASGARLRCAAHVSAHRSAYSTVALSAKAIMEMMRQLQEAREAKNA
jgi:hypothetical protein